MARNIAPVSCLAVTTRMSGRCINAAYIPEIAPPGIPKTTSTPNSCNTSRSWTATVLVWRPSCSAGRELDDAVEGVGELDFEFDFNATGFPQPKEGAGHRVLDV